MMDVVPLLRGRAEAGIRAVMNAVMGAAHWLLLLTPRSTRPQAFQPRALASVREGHALVSGDHGGRVYLDSMTDHGGNATRAWIAIVHLIFAKTQASNVTLIATALHDPMLLLIALRGPVRSRVTRVRPVV